MVEAEKRILREENTARIHLANGERWKRIGYSTRAR
jgi:hypothetical protein